MPKHHSSPLKCGVIGYGGAFDMGKKHLREMQLAGMVPTAVCEIDPGRLDIAKIDYPGIQIYTSVDDMLAKSDVEILAIITPHNTHAPLAIKCLNAGKHVVCEKPFAITTEECDAMIAAARAHDLVVSTYHNRHWDGWILRALDVIHNKNGIGEVYKIKLNMGSRGMPREWWRSFRTISGGILYDWGVHLLEYALQLLPNQKVKEVSGYSKNGFWVSQADTAPWKGDPNEDEGRLIARMDSGAWIELMITTLDSVTSPRFIEVIGTAGAYEIEWNMWRHTRWNGDVKVIEEGRHPPDEGKQLYQNINDHIMHGAELVITPEWARRMIHIIDLANRSATEGRALPVKYG